MSWTEEEVSMLVKLANSGLTAEKIALRLSTHSKTVTRNAVIGKLKRIGVALRGPYATKTISPESRARDFLSRKEAFRKKVEDSATPKKLSARLIERKAKAFLYKPFVADAEDFQPGKFGVLDIPNLRCRYIVSPEDSLVRFCGRAFDIKEKHWWCEEHRKIVFKKMMLD